MRGYLKSPGHEYRLDADVVSIGKGFDKDIPPPAQLRHAGAHIPLESGKAEPYHAVVVKRPEEKCYILTDLDTAYGTFVNEQKIQNETVKLRSGDEIRFGHGGITHKFNMAIDESFNTWESMNTLSRPASSASQRGNFVETGYLENRKRRPMSSTRGRLPLMTAFSNGNIWQDKSFKSQSATISPPTKQQIFNERLASVSIRMTPNGTKSRSEVSSIKTDTPNQQVEYISSQEGWSVNGQDMIDSWERETTFSKASTCDKEQTENEPWYVAMLREKEQRLLHMGDEISRLSIAEKESRRKDEAISELQNRISQMEQAAKELSHNSDAVEQEFMLIQMKEELNRLSNHRSEDQKKDKLIASLQNTVAELQQKNVNEGDVIEGKVHEIDNSLLQAQDSLDEFRKELDLPIPDRRDPEEVITELRDKLEEKETTVKQLTAELMDANKEKILNNGLVQALQRGSDQKERKINKLMQSLEKAQRQTYETNTTVQAMSNKFSDLKEEKKHEKIVAIMEKELITTKEQLEAAQKKLLQQQEKLDKQRKELRTTTRQNKQYTESGKLSQLHAEELAAEVIELNHREQVIKVAKEQSESRLERLRSRIVQAVYTAPGAVKPETQLKDVEILSSLQKIIEDRSNFHQQLTDMGKDVPPLIVTLDIVVEEQAIPAESSQPNTSINERKSAKSGRKSAKR